MPLGYKAISVVECTQLRQGPLLVVILALTSKAFQCYPNDNNVVDTEIHTTIISAL